MTPEERVAELEKVYLFQDSSGGFQRAVVAAIAAGAVKTPDERG